MKSPQDEKLIKELYEKLNWFTFQAGDEEFDEKQVRAILQLLDTLDPIDFAGVEKECMHNEKRMNSEKHMHSERFRFGVQKGAERPAAKEKFCSADGTGKPQSQPAADNADTAFERFKKRYAVTDADLEKKDRARIIPFTGSEEISAELAPDTGKIPAMDAAGLRAAMEADENDAADTQNGRGSGRTGGSIRGVKGVKRVKSMKGANGMKSVKGIKSVNGINGEKQRRFWHTAGGRAAIAFLTVFTALAATGICTSAVQQKSFFEVVRDGVNSMKITVTGNEMESQPELEMESSDKVYYESWDEIKAENPEVVVPGYIPEGLELVELYGKEFGNYVRYNGIYEDDEKNILYLLIRCFKDGYAEYNIENDVAYIEEEEGILYYEKNGRYRGYGKSERCAYSVEWIDMKDLKSIIKSIS